MSKVIIIIDEGCQHCPYFSSFRKMCMHPKTHTFAFVDGYDDKDFVHPDWCPLPDLPEKRNSPEVFSYTLGQPLTEEVADIFEDIGWDDCIDTILYRQETGAE